MFKIVYRKKPNTDLWYPVVEDTELQNGLNTFPIFWLMNHGTCPEGPIQGCKLGEIVESANKRSLIQMAPIHFEPHWRPLSDWLAKRISMKPRDIVSWWGKQPKWFNDRMNIKKDFELRRFLKRNPPKVIETGPPDNHISLLKPKYVPYYFKLKLNEDKWFPLFEALKNKRLSEVNFRKIAHRIAKTDIELLYLLQDFEEDFKHYNLYEL